MTSKSSSQANQVTDAETAGSAWKSLYRVCGMAAMIMVVLILIQILFDHGNSFMDGLALLTVEQFCFIARGLS